MCRAHGQFSIWARWTVDIAERQRRRTIKLLSQLKPQVLYFNLLLMDLSFEIVLHARLDCIGPERRILLNQRIYLFFLTFELRLSILLHLLILLMQLLQLVLERLQVRLLLLLVRLQLALKVFHLSLVLDLHGLKGTLVPLRQLSLELVESIVVQSQLLPHLLVLLLEALDFDLSILQFLLDDVYVIKLLVSFTSESFEDSLQSSRHVITVLEVGERACDDFVADTKFLEWFIGKSIEYLQLILANYQHPEAVTYECFIVGPLHVHREFGLGCYIIVTYIYEVREKEEVGSVVIQNLLALLHFFLPFYNGERELLGLQLVVVLAERLLVLLGKLERDAHLLRLSRANLYS